MRNTPNYNLPQYEGTDKFTKEVLNDAFNKVDTAINDLQETFNVNGSTSTLTTQEVVNARNGKQNLKERIDEIDEQYKDIVTNDIPQLQGQMDSIVRNEIEIDIMNPPKKSGLLPLTNDKYENSVRLQAIFDYIKSHEITYQPNGKQYFGTCYKVKFPNCIVELSKTIEIKGQYLTIEGVRTIIKCDDVAFKITSSNARKMLVSGITFDSCNAFDINKDNIDCGMVEFYNCWYVNSPGYALKIIDQSAMYTFNKCHWYQCRYIIKVDNVDYTNIQNCWLSESPRIVNGECSAYFNGQYAIIQDSFIIPSGYDRDGNVTIEPTLTDIAWFETTKSLVVSGCRVSAEPNNKTLINCRSQGVVSPFNPHIIEVDRCHRLSSTKGDSVVRLFALPNKIKITNNSSCIANQKLIGYGLGYDVNNDVLYNHPILYRISVIVDDNIAQNSNAFEVPIELKKFIKYKEIEQGLIKKNGIITSPLNGTFDKSASGFKIITNLNKSGNSITKYNYLIKASWQTDTASANMKSVYVGILSFIGYRNSDNINAVKCVLSPLVALQGGSQANQVTPINITPLINNLDNFVITGGSTELITVDVKINGLCEGNGTYEIKEIMDGQFLF